MKKTTKKPAKSSKSSKGAKTTKKVTTKKTVKKSIKKNGKKVKTTKKTVKKTKTTKKGGKKGKKGKKVTKKRKVKTIIVMGPNGKKIVKIIDEDKERHKRLLNKIKFLEQALDNANKRMIQLRDDNFKDIIQYQLGTLLNQVKYKGNVVIKVKRPPPKDPVDFRGEMEHRKESKKAMRKKINQIIVTGNIPLKKHISKIDNKVKKTSKLNLDRFKPKPKKVLKLTPVILSNPSQAQNVSAKKSVKARGHTGRGIKRVSRHQAKADAKNKRALKRAMEKNKAIASLKLQI